MSQNNSNLKTRIESILKDEPGIFTVAVVNPLTHQEYSINSKPMRSASLIKLFIMAEAFARIGAGSLQAAECLSFTEEERVGGAGVLQELPADTSRTILQLIDLMITESDNIATNLLIDRLGEDSINARIETLGASDSILRRRMMDFVAAAKGRENMTSVRDTAHILQRIFHNQCVSASADTAMREILSRQTDRCKIPLHLPPGIVCQHKTGELPGAEHDAGIVYSPAGPYVVAIMSDDLPDPEQGRQLIARLSREIFDWFISRT
jgi:beta-lactamase class A